MSWKEMLVNEVCDEIIDCVNKTAPKSDLTTPYKMIRTTNVRNGEIDLENVFNVEKEVYEKWIRRGKPLKDDVILTREAPVGEVGILRVDDTIFLGQRTMMYRANKSLITPHFLYYSLRSSFVQNQLHSYSSGSTVSHVRVPDAKSFLVKVPKLKTQRRIADILSAYDDLIQKNLKRIKLLEQAAQNIYEEWFVNLRFPGNENTPINEETGLPEGWEEKGLCEFSSFKQYKTKIKVYEGEKEYLATANVDGIKISERGEYFSFDKKPSRAQIAPPLNSVWFARMSNTEKVLCFTENTNNDIMISSGFAGFKAEEKVFLPFLFCTINNDVFSNLKDSYSTGSTQVSINNKSINSIRFIEPEIQKIKEFGEKLYPSLEMINKLFVTNKKLKAARDILLPRLMNRTIEV